MIKKIGSAIATAALVGGMLAPAAFADTTIEISGNGANSTNTVGVTSACNASVIQKNKTYVKTNVSVSGKTGGNTASGNTGGDVTIDTGDVTNDVTISVGGSTNEATAAPNCCECVDGNLDATIKDNGANSTNTVGKTSSSSTSVKQKNKTKVKTRVKAKGKTGKNTANNNTNGTTEVKTGDVDNTVDVTVDAPSNSL